MRMFYVGRERDEDGKQEAWRRESSWSAAASVEDGLAGDPPADSIG